MTFGDQIRRGAGPYHLDRDTPVLKIDGNGGSPAPGSVITGGPGVSASAGVNTQANDTSAPVTSQSTGSGTAHQNMQPTLFLNTMIKL